MFVDLIWAFGLHAALYSCGTLHLREFARVSLLIRHQHQGILLIV